MRQLLIETHMSRDNLQEDEVNLLGYLKRSANISPVSRPEPATSSDLKEVVKTVERLEGKIDALKELVDTLKR